MAGGQSGKEDSMANNINRSQRNRLRRKEIVRRAGRIRLLLTDCDGVLTDTGVYYTEWGESMKRFSIRDGMAVALLREAGIECGIISGETSQSLQRRCEKLDLQHVYLGAKDKLQILKMIARTSTLAFDELAYIGDDVNDLELMRALIDVGLVAAPRDAMPAVLAEAHYICQMKGGQGAFREFADLILSHRNVKGEPKTQAIEDEIPIVRSPFLN
jgi:3-deoxy-D-manno-octulosonate 8-phosphate phosphatase (KDO 8-P phosphatase)